MNVCVIGAGVIGLTTAYALARRGVDVTVIEANARAGMGTSYANGAQLSYAYVAPLADASIWRSLPGYLLDPESPLTWRPRLDPDQWSWILRFLSACRTSTSVHTTAELLKLSFFSRQCLDETQQSLAIDFGRRTAGKLVMLPSAGAVEKSRRQVELQADLGCVQEVLSPAKCVEVEPALARGISRWAGGVFTASEEVGDCAVFCQELAHVLSTRFNVQFRFGTSVTGVMAKGGRIDSLVTNTEPLTSDIYVLANGTGTAALGKKLGMRFPVYPLKGYSVTLAPSDHVEALPKVSITDAARKIVYAQIGGKLRVAGRAELVGHDLTVDQRRCEELAHQAQTLFPVRGEPTDSLMPWAGLRPATPTGLPLIGSTPMQNVFINGGHGALGWTLASGSAEILARQIFNEPAPFDTSGYRL